jgi:group I intron endonuclease
MKESGVYEIRNIFNNEIYIGSSINLLKRKYDHFYLLRKNNHSNKHLQNSFNKYGEDNFKFTIIKFCKIDKCLELEQFYINELNPFYNINPFAGNSMGIKHSEETKKKMSNSLMGHIVSESTKEKQRKSMIIICKNRTNEEQKIINEKIIKTREKNGLSETQMKISKPILQLSLNNNPIKEWLSCNQIMRELGYHAIHISRCCRDKRKTSYGYKWKYLI